MSDKRRIAATSGRVLGGAISVAVAAATVVGVGQLDLPVIAAVVPSATVAPTASDQSRLCPGPLLQQGSDASAGREATAFGKPEVTVATNTPPDQTALSAPDNLSGDLFGLPTVLSVASEPGQETPPIAAAQSQAAGLDDLTGFAAAACGEVSADRWIVAGATNVGRSSLLTLSNPTRADAVVDLSLYSETGEIAAPGAQGFIVKAGEQRMLSLASLAPGVRTPVIRVQTTGGRVHAALQQSVIRGITPGGVELAAPTAAPATAQVIPGVVIAGSASTTLGDNYDDTLSTIRVLVPGTEPAQVSISFTSEQGAEAPAPLNYPLEGGIVSEVTLTDLPAGSYAVSITSDWPVVAAARTTADAGASSDFAWFTASAPLAEETTLAVAPGPTPRLHLFNPTAAALDVVLTDRAGATTTVAVPAGEAAATALRSGMTYDVSGVGGAHAQVSYQGASGFSAYAIQPANPSASPVTVYPR